MGIIFLTGVALHLSWEVSVLEEEARTLSEEVAIGRVRLEDLERKVEALSSKPRAAEIERPVSPADWQSPQPTD